VLPRLRAAESSTRGTAMAEMAGKTRRGAMPSGDVSNGRVHSWVGRFAFKSRLPDPNAKF